MKPSLNAPASSDAAYRNVGFLLLLLLLIVVWGFYRTYFGLFPTFQGITTVQHFHGAMLLAWFALLIVQPFLIKYRRYRLHRAVGKVSYVLIPLVLLSIFMVAKAQFLRQVATLPEAVSVGALALNVPALFAFAVFYGLAMYYRRNPAYHMRYMVATALLMLGPGTGRAFIIYGGMPFETGIEYCYFLTEILAAGLLIYDLRKGRPYQPYLVMLGVLLVIHLAWECRMMAGWQAFGKAYAGLFF